MPQRTGLLFASLVSTIFPAILMICVAQSATVAAPDPPTQGMLHVVDASGQPRGRCPLKHTAVRAEISGFLSRVTVTQEFENPFKDKIEAVYVFPLSASAAVDDMTMQVGDHIVRGRILRREQAQAVYEAARSTGQIASLLDQERPNIFTQSVANIMPGERVTVTISYVETLKYEDGSYEFSFPVVVGERYIPGAPVPPSQQQSGDDATSGTERVPDASRISPRITPPGTRAGHDISIEVALDAGVPIDGLRSKSHEIELERLGATSARVRLKNRSEIPNRDFILGYTAAGQRIADGVLTHAAADQGGYFTLILQPPERVAVEDVMPKELVFVLDTSGSMSGFPVEKAKEAMKAALDGLYPQDTFNLITFSGDTRILFREPVPATPENLRKAQGFLAAREGSGGTEMMKAVRAALDPSDSQSHIRIVCFMTDGHVGNDMEIIAEVQKHPHARVFSFGIGGSVNRFLLDKMAEYGRGEVEYVTLSDDGSAAARRFHERVRNPLLTDISIDWAGLPVTDVYPARVPDLFGAKPLILSGRYTASGRGVIRLRGKVAGRDFVREIAVDLPKAEPRHDVLATLWARARIDDLMGQDFNGAQQGGMRADLRETITQLGLEYRLMTQFTSFVAVEELTVTDGGQPRRVEVPVEVPEGVRRKDSSEDEDDVLRVSHGIIQGNSAGFTQTVEVTSAQPASIDKNSATIGRTFSREEMVIAGAGGGVRRESRVRKQKQPSAKPASSVGLGSGSGVGAGTGGPGGGGGGGGSDYTKVFAARKVVKPSPEGREARVLAKLHPSIAAVIERLKNKGASVSPDESKFVHDGKADIQVWLTDKSPEILARLKQLGFEIMLDPKTSRLVIGRLAVDKLAALAELDVVRYVAPQLSGG